MDNIVVWFNLVFWVPIGVSMLLILVTVFGGLEHEVHFHVGGHEIGGHDFGHAGHGHEAGASNEHDPMIFRALNVLGIGKAPMTIVFQVFLILFGVGGLCANMVFQSMKMPPSVFFPISAIIGGVVTLVLTGRIAAAVGRLIPQSESYATTKHDWAGLTGMSVVTIDQNGGSVQIKDALGTVHQPLARCKTGSIARGKEVLLEEYDVDGDYYVVSEIKL